MLAQEFRPTETGTLSHIYLMMKTMPLSTTSGYTQFDLTGQNSDPSAPGYNANYGQGTGGQTTVTDQSNDQSYVSIWITQHGKYGEYVCSVFGGLQMMSVCDVSMNGNFNETCALGTVCNPNFGLNGGCGDRGKCSLATTVMHSHNLRPESGGLAGPCGNSEICSMTQSLAPDHQKVLKGKDGWIEFEFKTPVAIEKHTTYFINTAVIGNTDVSKQVVWYSGAAWGDGGATARLTNNPNSKPPGAPANIEIPSDELRAAYKRDKDTWTWSRQVNRVFATKFTRCVSSAAQTLGFVTSGEKTGCCSARVSPQGGDKGAVVTITGRNFFPSDRLRCIFRKEDGTGGKIVNAEVQDYSYTTIKCKAPTFDPHSDAHRDCSNPALCQGTVVQVTNDEYTVGPQYMGPKWAHDGCSVINPTPPSGIAGASIAPWRPQLNCPPGASSSSLSRLAYLGQNPLKILFSEIFVAPTGSDTVGDGTHARPYATIQRGLDAANEYDQIVLMQGVYTGLGNRGLRHHGKKLQMMAYVSTDRYLRQMTAAQARAHLESGSYKMKEQEYGSDKNTLTTIIDCEHSPDGFILNNNKDSDSPYAGYIDTQDIVTKNCENLRIYDL
jgi:hypothetical protein